MRDDIKSIGRNFDVFLESSKQVYDFEEWFSTRVSDVSDILLEKWIRYFFRSIWFRQFRLLFEKYFQEINNMFVNKKSFNEKDEIYVLIILFESWIIYLIQQILKNYLTK